jgi:hypothetical protein
MYGGVEVQFQTLTSALNGNKTTHGTHRVSRSTISFNLAGVSPIMRTGYVKAGDPARYFRTQCKNKFSGPTYTPSETQCTYSRCKALHNTVAYAQFETQPAFSEAFKHQGPKQPHLS